MLDINLLPWHTTRQQHRRQIRHALNWTLLMIVGWSGCGPLWYACRCNEHTAQWLEHAASITLSPDDEQRLATEKWRLRALQRQQQRQKAAYQLAMLWQATAKHDEHIKAVEWHPEFLEWEEPQGHFKMLTDVRRAWQQQGIETECHALSATVMHCQRPSSLGNELTDE